ncbi:Glucose and ribitol dehydrogenase [Linum grandiflorum]
MASRSSIVSAAEQKYPPQHQDQQPGKEYIMTPLPLPLNPGKPYKPSNKLLGKVALVTGGDSGIGRSVCLHYALEGATVAFTYVKGIEDEDKDETIKLIKESMTPSAKDPIAIHADLGYESECQRVVDEFVKEYGTIDILVNNAAVQYFNTSIEDITEERLEKTFRTNIFAYFFMARFALRHMKSGGCIINTTSVVSYAGNKDLLDYSSTKGAITTFTRSLALSLVERGIRVNGVAPGPIWTPLQVACFPDDELNKQGASAAMNRFGETYEVASSYVFLASEELSSYFTGQVLHPNGGVIVNA